MPTNTQLNNAQQNLNINGLTVGLGAGNVSSNVAIGLNALISNTTGTNNVAIGLNALTLNSTGNNNTAVGSNALAFNVSGSDITAIGINSCNLMTAGPNTAMGLNSLSVCVSGVGNSALGPNSLRYATGNYNSSISSSMTTTNPSTGNRNCFISAAGSAVSSGNDNCLMGSSSFGFISDRLTTGNGNIGIGRRTGVGNIVGVGVATGSYNTFIGDSVTSNSTSATGTMAFGIACFAPAATGTTSADKGSGIAFGSANSSSGRNASVGFRGNNTPYLTASIGIGVLPLTFEGFWNVTLFQTSYKIPLYLD